MPRSNLEAWLKHLRLSFPVLPFKSSTQSQRNNLSQAHVPTLSASSSGDAPLPSTAASLGAPALLRLLKQYALSRPHQTLTVGIIGYPNVGKSSVINSLKRSRACAVAAQPGKTRIIQEVVLDKGVKVLDCPGVVLEDFGAHQEGEEQRRKRLGEVMLRNCIKVEEIEDPIAPVEAILSRVDMATMQRLYPGVQPYANVTEFLIQVALSTGRLKGVSFPLCLFDAKMLIFIHHSKGFPTWKQLRLSFCDIGTTERFRSIPPRRKPLRQRSMWVPRLQPPQLVTMACRSTTLPMREMPS